jgi:hypothetical protein
MKRMLTVLTLGASLFVSAAAHGQELPHMEFVRALRDRNHPDLAMEYLEKLAKTPNLPKEIVAALPLEIARTQLEVAAKDPDPARRARVYGEARVKMEAYLAANAAGPDAAVANLDLAKIYSFQAKAIMEKAKMAENIPARDAGMAEARKGFGDAYKRLTEAYDAINAQLIRNKDNRSLTNAKLEAEFERANTSLNMLFTFTEKDDPQERATVGTRAIDELKVVSNRSDRTGWMALAMLIRAYDELDTFDKAEEIRKKFDSKDALEPGKRMADAYYFFSLARKDPLPKKVRDIGIKWLTDYRSYADTPEGIQIRYTVADSAKRNAQQVKDQKSAEATALYDLARKYYEEVEHTESRYAEAARTHKVEIMIAQNPALSKGDISALATPRECFIRAQVEVAQINQESGAKMPIGGDAKKWADDHEKMRKAHYRNIIEAVNRGLAMGEEGITQQEIIDARFLLIYHLLEAEDPYTAVIHGEDLARTHPGSSRAGMAGAYALSAYAQLIFNEEKKNGAGSPEAQIDRARMKSLANYLETNWKGDIVADEARFQLGATALRQKNYPEAVVALMRVSPGYPNYTLVLYQVGAVAREIAGSEKKGDGDMPHPPQGYKSWNDLAMQSFQKIPQPKSLKNPEIARYYFMGKASLAYMLFGEKKLDEVDKLTAQLQKDFPQLPQAIQTDLEPMLTPLPFYAKYGKADILFKSNDPQKYTKVMALLGPIVKQIADKKLPEGIEPALPRIILFLHLKSCLLDGKIDEAGKALEMIQAGSGFENQGAVLASLVKDLSDQIKELEKKGPAGKAEHDKAVANFSAFLDTLAKQDLSKIKPELLRFLAQSYSAMKKHEKAAELLSKIPEPPAGSKPEEIKAFRFIRLMLAREYRLAKKFDEADKIHKELDKADFGATSLEFREEKNWILEDRELWGAAANAWKKMYDELGRAAVKNARLKGPHQHALYRYIFCVYRFAQKQTMEKKKADFTKRAANMIVQLEKGDKDMGGLKDEYMELLKQEKPLKDAYDELKAKASTGAAGAN